MLPSSRIVHVLAAWRAGFTALLVAAPLAACGGGTIATPPPPVVPTGSPASSLSVHVSGKLAYVGDVVTVTATQGAYTGPFTFTASDGAVLALSLTAPATPGSKAGAKVARTKQVLVSPNGTAYVEAVGPGTASVRVAGSGGATVTPVALRAVAIPMTGSVIVSPTSLSFTQTGSAHVASVAVAQGAYAGSFTERDSCLKIATLVATSNAGGEARYTVTPEAAGTCSATFTGAEGKAALLKVVVVAGAVVLAPASLHFTSAGSSSAKSVAVSQANYSGAFTQTTTCTKIATVAAASNANGKAVYTVTPTGPGSCTATFFGGVGKSASLPIAVTLPSPTVTVVCAQSADACSNGTATKPGSVQFTAVGDTATLTPSDPKWSDAPDFTLQSDTCNKSDDPSAGGNWATFSPAAGKSAASFKVTAKGAGTSSNTATCTATFADAAGRTVGVTVEVTLGNIGIDGKR